MSALEFKLSSNDDDQEKKTREPEMKWYVIHTYSTYENKVKQYLESKIENSDLGKTVSKIVIPMVEETVFKDGKEKTELKKAFPDIPVELEDERFTSTIAHRTMIDGGMKKSDRRVKGNADKISAVLILQSYLDRKANQKETITE